MSAEIQDFLSNPPAWLVLAALGAAAAAALLALACAFVALRVRGRVAHNATEISSLQQRGEEMQAALARRIDEAQLSLDQKVDEVRSSAQAQADQSRSKADAAKQFAEDARTEVMNMVHRLGKFEEYFRNVFEKNLSTTFANFDQTVTGVLGQMRSELERGISRIDQMKSMVESRTQAEKRLVESTEEVQKLLDEGEGKPEGQPQGDTSAREGSNESAPATP
ncbi:MAG: hypothetical protein AB1696_07325 [Planctomycetota bacterium]